ncbi:hypothetical protein BsWGS_23979 [Bradybaena similaris]
MNSAFAWNVSGTLNTGQDINTGACGDVGDAARAAPETQPANVGCKEFRSSHTHDMGTVHEIVDNESPIESEGLSECHGQFPSSDDWLHSQKLKSVSLHNQKLKSDVLLHNHKLKSDIRGCTYSDPLARDGRQTHLGATCEHLGTTSEHMGTTCRNLRKFPSAECSRGCSQTGPDTFKDQAVTHESLEIGLQMPKDKDPDAAIHTQICEPASSTESGAHSSTEPRAHSSIEHDGHSSTEPRAHSSTEPKAHSSTEPDSHSSTEPRAHSSTEPDDHSSTEPRAHSSTEPRAHSSTEPRAHCVEKEKSDRIESELPDKPIKYKCLKCCRVMKDKRLIENHSCDHEPEEDKVKISITLDIDCKSFLCKECNYSNSGHNFEEHLMCHLMVRPYQCLYCKECFINRKEISRHVLKSHNGAKMSCALRALRKAKALIKEVTALGTISFMAKVAGKVPLEKDPDKKKKSESSHTSSAPDPSGQNPATSDPSGQNMTLAVPSHQDKTQSDRSHQNKIPSQRSDQNVILSKMDDKTVTKSNQADQDLAVSKQDDSRMPELCEVSKMMSSSHNTSDMTGKTSRDLTVSDNDGKNMAGACLNSHTEFRDHTDSPSQSSGGDPVLRPDQMFSVQVGSENHQNLDSHQHSDSHQNSEHLQNYHGFSKLREVLSLGSSELKPNSSSEAGDNSDSEKSCSDSGLKIVASFSLKNMTEDECDLENVSSQGVIDPGFSVPVEAEREPEVLSFLGRIASGDNLDAPMPSPAAAPLQPAVLNSPDRMSSAKVVGSVNKHESNPHFFVCGFNCLFSSISAVEFKEHTVNFHSSEAFFPCNYCGHRSPNETDLVRHISNHTQTHNKSVHLYICGNDGCRFGSNLVADYISHFRAAHPDTQEPMCHSCGDSFSSLSMLQCHVENNVIHIVNCPYCSSKATDRKVILNHISSTHPGKPKMVSVAKQLICHDRKMNNYVQVLHPREMLPPTLTPAPAATSCSSGVDQILGRHDHPGDLPKCKSLSKSRDTPSPLPRASSPGCRQKDSTPEGGRSPQSDSSDFGSAPVKEEVDEDTDGCKDSEWETRTVYIVDENGIRRRVYVPMSERQAENYRCRHCTFIARDFKRMHCHEKSHGMPPTKKERFKCMFCPQGFDSELKFRLHITCHPGLIKFLLYRCKKCEFDTNQKHTMVRHIACNRDRKHRGFGPVEEQFTVVSRSLESRVMECDRCDYMTRHKIHMTIHYQRQHNILKDRGELTVEGITPTDTPLSSYDLSPQTPLSLSPYNNFRSPDISQDNTFDFPKPSGSAKKCKDSVRADSPVITLAQINERNDVFNRMVSHQAALQPGHVAENQMRKFKCPICKYLLPKAADLKNHVKRHSEIGQITLIIFRCRYCSCMSTARELLYEHLVEKHAGKPIALVKKIVAIDTMDVDKSFAETTMEETLDQLEEQLRKEIMSSLSSKSSLAINQVLSAKNYEQVFVIPEGSDTFGSPLQCPKCPFNSFIRSEIVFHVSSLHSEIKVIGNDEDLDSLVRATACDFQSQNALSDSKPQLSSQEEVLIVPDDQIFKEPALCSRCDFSTLLRREMVMHLQQNHPEIAVMGRNSFPVQVTAMGYFSGPMDESCIVGSGSLDAKLRCLYENYGTQMKCLICGTERPKKFFIHVHILRHLNVYLWKCAFCAHRGLQKYKMVDHIKKIHPGKPLSVRYLRVNVDAKVAQFLEQFNTLKRSKDNHKGSMDLSFRSLRDELVDQTNNDTSKSRQKALCLSGSNSPHSLGSDELDDKISCLYDNCGGVAFKCIACHNQFQRKFAMHRHIIMAHLKVALLACAYCGMEGVERHQIVDHILACHRPAPVNILPLDIDLQQTVSEFLTRLAAGELSSTQSKLYAGMFGQKKANKKMKFGSMKFSKSLATGKLKKNSTVDPDVLLLGRYALDQELGCLYQERPSGQLRCLVCRWEFPKKYPLHRHIMLKHLKMSLLGCPYCPFEGIEKYNVSVHIKEAHGDKPVSVRFLEPDVRERVKKFVEEMTSTGPEDVEPSSVRESTDSSLLTVAKVENNDEEENANVNDEEDEKKNSDSTSNSGLVVAMFGKKKPRASLGSVFVKTEIKDEDFKDSSNLLAHDNDAKKDQHSCAEGEQDGGGGVEERKGSYKGSKYLSSAKTKHPYRRQTKHPYGLQTKQPYGIQTKHSYGSSFSESYRSPAGGKPKALDVITKIKVLKAKEGQIVKFYCEMCKFTSLHRSNVVRHIYKIHEKYQTQTCPLCTYQTLSPMLMQRHTEKEHPGAQYTPGSAKQNHPKLTRKPKMGPLSFQKRRQNMVVSDHQSPKTSFSTASSSCSSAAKQYACAYCHYETNTQEDILRHTRTNHSQGEDPPPAAKSPNSSSKNNSKSEDQPMACWDGSKKAVKRRVPEEDEVGYKRKRKFIFEKSNELIQCGHCDTKETTMSRMQDHVTWDHPGLPFQAKRIPAWRFICRSCSVKTMATSKMKYHLNRHVNYRPYTCLNCGAFFPSPDQCRRHSRSQAHEEQYTYVRLIKKEARVAELLEGTRQLALKVQDEACKDPDFDIARADIFIAKFQEFRGNLKRSIPAEIGKLAKKVKKRVHGTADESEAGAAEAPRKQTGKSPQTVGVEQDVTIKCYNCDFTSSNVSNVKTHHNQEHPTTKFLWTELERGFTCDSSGEALPECDSVPCTSTDVGYTTRMTLGAGSNTMRFKCKTCDFSSCVIQAMKSHLKSHQPKGFMCPYCSRSFSGKEKLMRHQYCLHKGQPLWVIHLRMSGVTGSTTVKKVKAIPPEDSPADVNTETVGKEPAPKTSSNNSTVFLCSECPYMSASLYHFRLHLAQRHEEFRHKIRDAATDSPLKCSFCPFVAETEIDLSIHTEAHSSSGSFQCGYCDYNSADRLSVQCHLAASHGTLDPKVLHQGMTNEDKYDLPLLVNLKPNVRLERVPELVLTQFRNPRADMLVTSDDDGDEEVDEGNARVHTESGAEEGSLLRKTSFDKQLDDDDDNEERLVVVDESHLSSRQTVTNDYDDDDDDVDEDDISKAEHAAVNSLNLQINELRESKKQSSILQLLGNEVSCSLDLYTHVSNLQLDISTNNEHDSSAEKELDDDDNNNDDVDDVDDDDDDDVDDDDDDDDDSDDDVIQSDEAVEDEKADVQDSRSPSNSSPVQHQDFTLFTAQETDIQDHNEEADDDDVDYDNDTSLSSPLPMISLGDGVTMSPVNMDVDSAHQGTEVGVDHQRFAADLSCERLLDV